MSSAESGAAAHTLALMSLPRMGPKRLAALLDHASPVEIWSSLIAGRAMPPRVAGDDVIRDWRRAARTLDVADRWRATHALGISVLESTDYRYPARLAADPEPPALLFAMGEPIGGCPTVAIIGTRQCTAYGRRAAFELGAGLSEAGVSVVSGLALGIDAAGHQGALSAGGAPPLGVVGSGLDVIYPRANRDLWHRVATQGTLLSETPPGVAPARWRFPARNRIIAALADAVVVVESHAAGGSLSTVDEAQARDIPVGAVPGPITSSASAGTNTLIADGAVPVLGLDDVLLVIDHVAPKTRLAQASRPPASELLDQMGHEPVLLEQLCLLTARSVGEVASEVERLIAEGRCVRSGPWIERVA